MKTQNSNKSTRKKHIRRATFLTLIPVLLAGLGGFLFPLSNYVETRINGEDCAAKMNELAQTQEALALLDQQLLSLQSDFAKVLELDKQWEAEMSAGRGPLKVEIEGLESGMAKRIEQIDLGLLDSLGQQTADTYTALLGARKTIWELRNASLGAGSETEKELDNCEEEKNDLEDGIKSVADKLETEADELEKVKPKGILSNKEEVENAIKNKTRAMRRLVSRLRGL